MTQGLNDAIIDIDDVQVPDFSAEPEELRTYIPIWVRKLFGLSTQKEIDVEAGMWWVAWLSMLFLVYR